jgi:hypothetical protein
MIRAALLAFLLASPALAQQGPPPQRKCGPRNQITSGLANKYMEQPRWGAVAPDGAFFEVWTNEKTATWTIFVTPPAPKGTLPSELISCFLSSGTGFEFLSEDPALKHDDDVSKDAPAMWSPNPQ